MSRARECGTKIPHRSRGAALKQIRSLIQAGTNGRAMQAYRCPHCGAWHVGHRKNRRR